MQVSRTRVVKNIAARRIRRRVLTAIAIVSVVFMVTFFATHLFLPVRADRVGYNCRQCDANFSAMYNAGQIQLSGETIITYIYANVECDELLYQRFRDGLPAWLCDSCFTEISGFD